MRNGVRPVPGCGDVAGAPGVWAAGNVIDPRAQVITAAGAGSAAAVALNADLVEDDVRNAVRDLDHGLPPSPTAPPDRRSQHDHPRPTPSLPPGAAGLPTMHQLTPVVRTFVLATIAGPIVVYGLMRQLHRLGRRLMIRTASR
jgi:hypothetical protein